MKNNKQQNIEIEKTLVITLLILLILPLAYAITIQELISSYNFDYYGEEIDLSNVTDSINSNTLSFNISIENAIAGDYTFYIDLEDANSIATGERFETLSSSGENVIVNVSTYLLSGKEKFNYTLRIYDENSSLIYRYGNLTTQVYSSYDTGYEVLGVVDSNVNNDLIRLNISLNSSVSSIENVSIFLQHGDKFISTISEESLNVGLNYIILDLDNEKIIVLNLTTSVYDHEDFAKTSYFKDYNSSFVDLDSNNLTDYIEFNFTVDIKENGNYLIEAMIYDLYQGYVSTITKNQSLNVGEENVIINLNGSEIYSSKLNGPYKISVARLILESDLIDSEFNSYTTNESSYSDFERPPMPDLEISMTSSFDGVNNKINVTIENIGEIPAFNIFIDVFDNSNFEAKNFYSVLNAGESHIFYFITNGTNESIFIGIVDFDNYIDEENESNNLAIYNPLAITNPPDNSTNNDNGKDKKDKKEKKDKNKDKEKHFHKKLINALKNKIN